MVPGKDTCNRDFPVLKMIREAIVVGGKTTMERLRKLHEILDDALSVKTSVRWTL